MADVPESVGQVAAGIVVLTRIAKGRTADAAVELTRDDCRNLITLINTVRCPPEHREST